MKRDVYRFANYSINRRTQVLTRSGERIALTPKATQLLLLVLDNAPNVVSREELRKQLWGDSTYIEFEGALNACVRQCRAALGDTASDSRFIETVPKRGYRFVGALTDAPLQRVWTWFLVAVAATVAIVIAITMLAPSERLDDDTSVIRQRLVVLPAEGDTGVTLDPVAGYGIAMIASEIAAKFDPDRLEVINSRSIRRSIDQDWDLSRISSPDYVVRTRISKQASVFSLEATLLRTQDGLVIATLTEDSSAGMTALLRNAPEHIARWLADALDYKDIVSVADTTGIRDEALEDLYVQASWHLESGTISGNTRALELFEQILRDSPDDVRALEGKIRAIINATGYGDPEYPLQQAYADLMTLAENMEARGIHSSQAYAARGYVSLFRDWDIPGALNHTEGALLMAPHDARLLTIYAAARAASGDIDGAVASVIRAERLDPSVMAVRSDRCWYENLAGRFEDAEATCSRVLEMAPFDAATVVSYSHTLNALGRRQEALDLLVNAILHFEPSAFQDGQALPGSWQELGCVRAEHKLQNNTGSGVSHYQVAEYLMMCGKRDDALAQLRLSIDKREYLALYLPYALDFRQYADDPEFQQLLRRLPQID